MRRSVVVEGIGLCFKARTFTKKTPFAIGAILQVPYSLILFLFPFFFFPPHHALQEAEKNPGRVQPPYTIYIR